MSSTEKITGVPTERMWTYDTPYDIVQRREVIRQYGKSSLRVAQMDAYIDYINNEMPAGYVIITDIVKDDYTYATGSRVRNEGTRIYRPDRRGRYQKYAHIVIDGQFYGDKILFDNQDVMVVNTEAAVAVSPLGSVKMINTVNPEVHANNVSTDFYQKMKFSHTLETIQAVEKGERLVDWNPANYYHI